MKRLNTFAPRFAAEVLLALLASTLVGSAGEDLPVGVEVSVARGDRPTGNATRPLDGHLRTNGTLVAAVNFGGAGTVLRGPGAAIPFSGTTDTNPSGTNWSTIAPQVDINLNVGFSSFDPLLYSEVYGDAPVSLTVSNLNPTRTYVVQILHGEPRACCSGDFANNTFTTRISNDEAGPTVAVPAFQLGNGIANEATPNSNDLAVVTAEFYGLTAFTYVMRDAVDATRGPSMAAFQLRLITPETVATVSVNQGDNQIGNRPIDGYLSTNGVLRTAVNFGAPVDETRGPGAGILFTGGYTNNLSGFNWFAVADDFETNLEAEPTDWLFFSEIYGADPVSLTYTNLNPEREYLVQILHGEPRNCCSGYFTNNQFATVRGDGTAGPTLLVPPFQLGNGVMDEVPPNSNDLAVVTLRFSGLEAFTYLAHASTNNERGPSISGFQVRELSAPVTTLADGGPGSLRRFLRDVPSSTVVTFPTNFSGQTISLTNGPLIIDGRVIVDASMLPGGLIINGNGAHQLVFVASNVIATLRSLTLTNGYSVGSNGFGYGGAVVNWGTLTLDQCVVSGNRVQLSDVGVAFGGAIIFGGGVFNFGTLTVNECFFFENTASGRLPSSRVGGGALASAGSMTIHRTTFSMNRSQVIGTSEVNASGGAIFSAGPATVNQCTFYGNVASVVASDGSVAEGGAIFSQDILVVNQSTVSGNSATDTLSEGALSRGGGIVNGGLLTLSNSIVAGNFADSAENIAYTYTELGTNLLSGDPGLAPLGDYGGPTPTMPPQPLSPAIDSGIETGTNGFSVDQRGLPRRSGASVDVGAVEFEEVANVAPTNVVISPSVTLPTGTNLTLSIGFVGSTPARYQWFLNKKVLASATNAVLNVTNVQTKNAGAYTVRVQNDFGAATSGVATVKVLLPARVKTQPKAQTVLAGKRASLRVSATGTKPLRYQWRRNSIAVPGATNATLTIPVTTPTDEGFYSVYVWNDAGDSLSTNVYLAVPPMQITSQPRNLAVNAGARVTLSVRATTRYPLSYQWSLEGTNLPGATNASLLINGAQPVHRGTYTVTLTNAVGELSTTGAVLSVTVLPVRITSHPRSVNVKTGAKATFSVSAAGSPPFSYQWRLGGDDLAGATNATLVITNAQAGDAGTYSVVVRNAESEATSLNALLNVIAPAIPGSLVAASSENFLGAVRLSIVMGSDGSRRLVIAAPAEERYVLEASADLLHWTPLMESSESGETAGSVVFIDGGAGEQTQRFYRVRVLDRQKSNSP